MMIRICWIAVFAWLTSSSVTMAQPVSFFVDNFTQTQNGGGDFASDTSPPDANAAWLNFGPFTTTNTIGGQRTLGNFLVANNSGGIGNTNVTTGIFRIANPDNAYSAGQITWDGTTSVPGSGGIPGVPAGMSLGLNVEAGVTNPAFNFEYSVLNRDLRTWTYTIRAYSSTTDYFERILTTTIGGNGNFSQTISLVNSSFTSIGTPLWTNINAITFAAEYDSFVEGLGGDLSINFVRFVAVPELSTWLMIGLSGLLVGSVYVRRRNAKTQATPASMTTEDEVPVAIPALAPACS